MTRHCADPGCDAIVSHNNRTGICYHHTLLAAIVRRRARHMADWPEFDAHLQRERVAAADLKHGAALAAEAAA